MSFENILNMLMSTHYLEARDLSVLKASCKQVNQQITEIGGLQGYKKESRRIDDAHVERQTMRTKQHKAGCPSAPKKNPIPKKRRRDRQNIPRIPFPRIR